MAGEDSAALYRLFDEDEQLLYVGVASDPTKRWRFHKRDKPWWRHVRVREIEWFPSRAEALLQEATEIATRRPLYNRHGGWQYLRAPEPPSVLPGFVLPSRGTSKLPAPSTDDLLWLQQAVANVRNQEREEDPFQAPAVSLPERERRITTRRAFGLAQEKISSVFGVTKLRFSHWELGHKEPLGWDRLAYLRALEAMAEVVQRRLDK
ncbi:GIY-YIG nuclease family protein [Streptomyces sp. NPDC048389]|uniref:GIY-YIG nuclease family protein n=1 Tax=Streptomyces sp. NPDC048389 TaxID=3154622 RepID=UPI003454624E